MKIVFTDGSASPNPGPGGFSVIDAETKAPLILGRSKKTTNIVMEGEAMVAAIEKFPEVEILDKRSDEMGAGLGEKRLEKENWTNKKS